MGRVGRAAARITQGHSQYAVAAPATQVKSPRWARFSCDPHNLSQLPHSGRENSASFVILAHIRTTPRDYAGEPRLSRQVLPKLSPPTIAGCKLAEDASEDSWFCGRRRVSAVELRLQELPRREKRQISRQAAHSNPGCNQSGWRLVVSSRRVSRLAHADRSHP